MNTIVTIMAYAIVFLAFYLYVLHRRLKEVEELLEIHFEFHTQENPEWGSNFGASK